MKDYKAGEIYDKETDMPYQVIALAEHTQTGETMVIYQELYGEFRVYAKPLNENNEIQEVLIQQKQEEPPIAAEPHGEQINSVLLEFLEAGSHYKRLDILTSKKRHIDEQTLQIMASSLDCTIDGAAFEDKFEELVNCLKALSRFEDRRLR